MRGGRRGDGTGGFWIEQLWYLYMYERGFGDQLFFIRAEREFAAKIFPQVITV